MPQRGAFEMEKKIEELVELLKKTVEGKCAIALAGAHAKGVADAASDIDLYIFAERAKPYQQRLELIRRVADLGSASWVDEQFDAAPWGGGMNFLYRGTPVEVSGRTLERMDQVVGDCLKGKFEIIPATWTSNGYYTFIYLCELSFIKSVWDPDGVLAEYQKKAAVYPEPLRRAILETFMGRIETWMDNFHYESAIRRGDILFTAPIVLHTLMDMVQVVFALNRVYFTGDKKLEAALSKMPFCPEALRPCQLDILLTAARDPETLAQQRRLLRQTRDELSERVQEVLD